MTIKYSPHPESSMVVVEGKRQAPLVAAALTDQTFQEHVWPGLETGFSHVLFQNRAYGVGEVPDATVRRVAFDDDNTPVVLEALGFRRLQLLEEGGIRNRVAAWRTTRVMHQIVEAGYPTGYRPGGRY